MTPLHPVSRVVAGTLLLLALWFAIKDNRPPPLETTFTRIYYAPAEGAPPAWAPGPLPSATLVDTAAMTPLIHLAVARRLLETRIASIGGRAVVRVLPNGLPDSIRVFSVDHVGDIDESLAAADLGEILARGLSDGVGLGRTAAQGLGHGTSRRRPDRSRGGTLAARRSVGNDHRPRHDRITSV